MNYVVDVLRELNQLVPPYSSVVRVSKMSNEDINRAIDASHPEELDTATSRAADQLAMMLIHNRHEKREIVNLLRWCLLGFPQNA